MTTNTIMPDVSRRSFVKGAAGLTFSFTLAGSLVGRRLKQIFLYLVKTLAFLDKLALLEQHVLQVVGDSGVNFDFIDRLDPTHKVFGFAIGLRSARTVPTGTAAGACPCANGSDGGPNQ